MNISYSQSISLFFLIGISLISIFLLNNIIILENDLLIKYLGGIVAITWVSILFVLSSKGFNEAIKNNYYGFLAVLGLFHLGIPLGNFLNYSNDYYDGILSRWYYDKYTINSYIAVYLFILGYLLNLFVKIRKVEFKTSLFKLDDLSLKVAFCFYIFIVIAWVIFVKLIGGVNNYSQYALLSSSSSIFSFIFSYGNNLIGILYVLTSSSKQYSKRALYILLIWAFFALPIGLRGEVLFPLIIGLTFLIEYKTIKLNFIKIIMISSIVLTALSAIFVYRHGEAVENTEVSPFAALVEMGGSLRPVSESIKWISTNEVNLYLGETYWAPLERLLSKFIPYIQRLPANEDMRLMNVLIADKAGPYGFSIIAESFINFSFLGCFLVGIISGFILKYYDSLANKNNFLILAIVFAIFFHIRQSFVGAFGVFLTFLIVCIVLNLISYGIKGKKL